MMVDQDQLITNIEKTMIEYLIKKPKEYHKMIKKLEEQKKGEKLYGEKENKELAESYKESRKQQKDRDDKKK